MRVAVVAVLCSTIAIQAQVPQAPRDTRAAQPSASTGVIRGRITAADTGLPLHRAIVTTSGTTTRSVQTDVDGRYEFLDLPRGRYSVAAGQDHFQVQYITQLYRRPPDDIGTQLVVDAGHTIDGIDIALSRAGVITGRLIDEDGNPVSLVQVGVEAVPGERTRNYMSVMTDDRGRFRLFNLVEGRYYVAAMPPRGGDAIYPDAIGFTKTWAPGVISRAEAAPVRVRAGEETTADITIVRTRLYRIAGVLLDSQGRPAPRATVSLAYSHDGGGSTSTGISTDGAGRFEFQAYPPASYLLHARLEGREAGVMEYADMMLALAGDATDIVLAARPGVDVSGEVVFAEGRPVRMPPGIEIRTVFQQSSSSTEYGAVARPDADLRFTLKGMHGSWLLRPSGLRGQWYLQAVVRGNQDVTDVPTEFRPDDRVQIVLTNRAGCLEGQVTNARGPAQATQVFVLPEDRTAWQSMSSRVYRVLAGQDGRYRVDGVLPGHYFVVAVGAYATGYQEFDSSVLEALVRDAVRVVITGDETRTVDIKVSGSEDVAKTPQ